MRKEFAVHLLNKTGLDKANAIGEILSGALTAIEELVPASREMSLVVTKLQEAKHFAVRGVALQHENQQSE